MLSNVGNKHHSLIIVAANGNGRKVLLTTSIATMDIKLTKTNFCNDSMMIGNKLRNLDCPKLKITKFLS